MSDWILECPNVGRWSDRLARSSEPLANGCVVWTGALDKNGYGKFRFRERGKPERMTGAHRAAWLAKVGPIPHRMVIDHLCRNTSCINIDHMEVVSNSVNALRGDHSNKAGRSGRKVAGTPQSCPTHGREDGYLFTDRRGYSQWTCRLCRRYRNRRYRERDAPVLT